MKAALYVRLSREDRNKVGAESESIINQQILLLEYCRQQNWDVYKVYIDEDYSGSDPERPAFCEMLKKAEQRAFDIILTKTLSRFARDMELIERYVNNLFPIWGIRFISLIDNADSENQANRKARQINSLVDQWMLEDVSINIRSTLATKRKAGQWVGAFAPFGYKKDPTNKNKLIIDEDAAEIVRYIFQCYLDGYGITTLARKLNQENIPNPASYKKSKGQPFQNKNGECSILWHHYSIRRILINQIYLGHTIQGMVENVSYKSSKKRRKPMNEWDIVKNTHEPIIEEADFIKVQEILSSRRRSNKTGPASIFANKVRCVKCGGSMRTQITGHQRYYICHKHYIAPDTCEGTYVSANTISTAVLKELKKLYEMYVDDKVVEEKLNISVEQDKKIALLQKQITSANNEIEKVKTRFKNLYFDKSDGLISEADFRELSSACKEELTRFESILQALQEKFDIALYNKEHTDGVCELISKFKDIKSLDRYTVELLIDYIEVGGNKQNRIIRIHWNF